MSDRKLTYDPYTYKIIKDENNVIIFYSDWCKYSNTSINLLMKKNIKFKGYNIDKITGGLEKLIEFLTKTKDITGYDTNYKSRPMIFYKKKFLGGYFELIKIIDQLK